MRLTFTLGIMYKCPECHAEGLRPLAVRWSYRETPAKCENCGRLWHVLVSTSNGIVGVGIVLASLSVAAAIMVQSWWLLLAGAALVVAHNVWAWRRVELFPISEEAAKTAAQVSWWLVAVGVFLRLLLN